MRSVPIYVRKTPVGEIYTDPGSVVTVTEDSSSTISDMDLSALPFSVEPNQLFKFWSEGGFFIGNDQNDAGILNLEIYGSTDGTDYDLFKDLSVPAHPDSKGIFTVPEASDSSYLKVIASLSTPSVLQTDATMYLKAGISRDSNSVS